MKKRLFFLIGILASIGLIWYVWKVLVPNLTGKSSFSSAQQMKAWSFTPTIESPLVETSTAESAVTLGSVETNRVSVTVDAGAFDEDTKISLSNPSKVPKVNAAVVDTIGAPIELSVGAPARLNEKAVVTFAFDPTLLPEGTEAYQMRVVYYNGSTWDYIKPTSVDLAQGTMTFETYHFSLLGANRISDDKKIVEQWIHSQALDSTLRDNVNEISDEVTNKVVDLMLEKMGISDKSLKGQVLGEVLKDDSYKELYDLYNQGDTVGFSQKVALVAGGKIAAIVPESAMQAGLASIAGDASEDVAKVAEAAGYMAEGQYKEAAKIIGEQIADKFLITTAGKIAVEVVDYQIQSWKNSEIDAAYIAYRDGADSYFYGYNNDPGDFETIWYQMRGIRRQLELEAIKKENDIRVDSGMQELSERQMEVIRENVKRSFKTQFEQRKKQEEIIKKEEERLAKIFSAFEKADFFTGLAPADLDKGYDLETKLALLQKFTEKLLRDTGRKDYTETQGYLGNDKVQLDEMVIAAKFYFSGKDGNQKYAEYLQEHFGVSLYPKLSELSGAWTGTMVISDVSYPPEWAESTEIVSDNKDLGEIADEACEGVSLAAIAAALEEMKGKENSVSLSLSPSSETGGTLTFSADDDGREMPFTYSNGTISASFTQDKAVVTLSFMPIQNDTNYTASGTIGFNVKDIIKMNGSLDLAKRQ